MAKENKSNIIIYQSEDGQTHIEVQMDEDTVWLSQQQMADLYQTSRTNVVEHIKHIYEDGELVEESTCRKIRQVRQEGARMVEREIPHYNLDMIISLGYRINSIQATHFRQWATARLKEYIIKGFTIDDERLKQLGGGYYWKELLDRIRDIRSSEKVMYRQVLDIYATAVDYDPHAKQSIEFFKIVQNKLHFAAHGHTAAEVIYERADADSETVLIDKSVRILTLVRGYCNPIIAFSAPDPTVIRAQDGYFYLYGTENTRNVPIYRSKNLVNWEYKGTAFTDATRPTWGGDHNIWAPEIRYFNNHYVLYYSWAIWGDEWRSNVGVAVSDSPLGPFIDKGCLIDSKVIGVQNSIDQFFYEDNGKKYMFWGSFRGIYATELTDNGLEIKKKTDGTPVLKKRICGNRFEGTNIYKRGEYYYLFASIGTCCNGATSTYQTVVGRSKNVLGPYLDKTGRDMLYDYCEIIMSGNETWAGPGHNSILIQDDVGTDWIIYHGYKKKEAENGRYVLMDKLIWSNDGWPSVKSNAPSILEVAPYFQK